MLDDDDDEDDDLLSLFELNCAGHLIGAETG